MANLPDYYVEARKLDGLKEIVGSEHEAQVVGFFAEAGHSWVKNDETAWCAAFENAMLARAGWEGTGKLTARSFLEPGWGQTVELDDVREGDIVVLKRGDSEWQGHVTNFVRWANATKSQLIGFGGNQKNAVGENPFSAKSVLGVRRPIRRLAESADTSGFLRKGMPKNKRVQAMQEQLKELGYPVGNPDGLFGNVTRDAVLAWKADNDLPLSPDVSPSDLDVMERSTPRPLSEERVTATTTEVKAVDGSVRNNSTATKVVVGTVATVGLPEVAKNTGVLDALKGAKEQVGVAKDIISQTVEGAKSIGFDVGTFVSSHSSLLLIVGLCVAAYFIWRSTRASVSDYREGRKL